MSLIVFEQLRCEQCTGDKTVLDTKWEREVVEQAEAVVRVIRSRADKNNGTVWAGWCAERLKKAIAVLTAPTAPGDFVKRFVPCPTCGGEGFTRKAVPFADAVERLKAERKREEDEKKKEAVWE